MGHRVTVRNWDFTLQPSGHSAYVVILPLFFLFNFLILMGPLVLMGITQMQSFEPGDAELGRQAQRRARPGGGEEGRPPGGEPLAVG